MEYSRQDAKRIVHFAGANDLFLKESLMTNVFSRVGGLVVVLFSVFAVGCSAGGNKTGAASASASGAVSQAEWEMRCSRGTSPQCEGYLASQKEVNDRRVGGRSELSVPAPQPVGRVAPSPAMPAMPPPFQSQQPQPQPQAQHVPLFFPAVPGAAAPGMPGFQQVPPARPASAEWRWASGYTRMRHAPPCVDARNRAANVDRMIQLDNTQTPYLITVEPLSAIEPCWANKVNAVYVPMGNQLVGTFALPPEVFTSFMATTPMECVTGNLPPSQCNGTPAVTLVAWADNGTFNGMRLPPRMVGRYNITNALSRTMGQQFATVVPIRTFHFLGNNGNR